MPLAGLACPKRREKDLFNGCHERTSCSSSSECFAVMTFTAGRNFGCNILVSYVNRGLYYGMRMRYGSRLKSGIFRESMRVMGASMVVQVLFCWISARLSRSSLAL